MDQLFKVVNMFLTRPLLQLEKQGRYRVRCLIWWDTTSLSLNLLSQCWYLESSHSDGNHRLIIRWATYRDKRNANSSFVVLDYSFQQGHLNKCISCWLMSYGTWLCRCRSDGRKTWWTKQDKVNTAHLNKRKRTLRIFIVSLWSSLILQCSDVVSDRLKKVNLIIFQNLVAHLRQCIKSNHFRNLKRSIEKIDLTQAQKYLLY